MALARRVAHIVLARQQHLSALSAGHFCIGLLLLATSMLLPL